MGLAADLDDIRRVATAGPFGVKGMDDTLFHRRDGVLDKAAFIQRVGMDHHLHIHRISNAETIVDGRRGGAPILMKFQGTCTAQYLFFKSCWQGSIALAGKGQVHRKRICRLQHPADMPRPGRDGCGQSAMRGPGAAAKHGGQAGMQGIINLLRADKMNMAVKAACCQDMPFTGNGLGPGADDNINAGLGIGIASLAYAADDTVLQPDIRLEDARHIHHQRVGNNRIDSALGTAGL